MFYNLIFARLDFLRWHWLYLNLLPLICRPNLRDFIIFHIFFNFRIDTIKVARSDISKRKVYLRHWSKQGWHFHWPDVHSQPTRPLPLFPLDTDILSLIKVCKWLLQSSSLIWWRIRVCIQSDQLKTFLSKPVSL